jgi:hypothetical protein
MSRELSHVVSVRFSGSLLAQVRKLAARDGQSVSDWIRTAAGAAAWDAAQPAPHPELGRITGWSCPHLTITSMPGLLGAPVTSYCGCEMTPLYEHADYSRAA